MRFIVRKSDTDLATWEVLVPPYMLSVKNFRVMKADLDSDGNPEFVVEVWVSVSNGMAISYSSLFVVDGRNPATVSPAIPVEDFGILGTLSRSLGGSQCRILETRWCYGSDPVRGPGLYLVGRWLGYRSGLVEIDASRPTVCRRYLRSFEKERNSAVAKAQRMRWFADARTSTGTCPDLPCR